MGRLGLTYQDIAEAADKLLLQHEHPTMENVRQYLGGIGSFTTISKHLNTWRSKRLMATVKEDPHKIIPPDQVSQAVQGVWEQLTQQANQEIVALKQETQAQIASLLAVKEQLDAEKSCLQKLLEEANLKINHLTTDNTLLQKKFTEEHRQHELLQKENQQLERQLQQALQDKATHTCDLQQNYENAREDWKKQLEHQEKLAAHNIKNLQTLLENQRTDFIVKLDELKIAKEKTDKTLVRREMELLQQTNSNKERAGQLAILEQENKNLQYQLKNSEQRYVTKEKEFDVIRDELQVKVELIDMLKQQVTALTQHIESFNIILKSNKNNQEGQHNDKQVMYDTAHTT